MADIFANFAAGLSSPFEHGAAVTPSDSVDLTQVTRALYVGGAGDVTLITAGGDTALFKAVPVGTTLNVRAARVTATGTTATNLLALW
jgi:hypothetical protein